MAVKDVLKSIEKYLLVTRKMINAGIPKDRALNTVQRTWGLTNREKKALYRVVWSRLESLLRAGKRVPTSLLRGQDLIIDGYNVLVGLASLDAGEAVLCDDDVVRDLRMSPRLEEGEIQTVLEMLEAYLRRVKPRSVRMLFDAPVSGSGDLAARVERYLRDSLDIPVRASAVKGVDEKLVRIGGIPVTSDSGIIDRVSAYHDAVREVAVAECIAVWIPPGPSEPKFVRAPVPEG
ncbi:DUF5616 domain-containing protein [Methanopyrus sp.]